MCGYYYPDTCSNITITNNIVAGTTFYGYNVYGHNCGESNTDTTFRNNIAHSINGIGASIYPDPLSTSMA